MFKNLFLATLMGAAILSSCDKQKDIERNLLQEENNSKSVPTFQLSETTLATYPFLATLKGGKALPKGFEYSAVRGAIVGSKYKHGECGSSKGLCAMDTLFPGVPSQPIYDDPYSIVTPMPTLDTLYSGHIYLISDNHLVYFPGGDMHLSNFTVPVSDTFAAPTPIATALDKTSLVIYPGLYPVFNNYLVSGFGYRGYVILDCQAL